MTRKFYSLFLFVAMFSPLVASGQFSDWVDETTKARIAKAVPSAAVATSGSLGITIHAADDIDQRDTQVLSVDFATGADVSLGGVHPLADLETLVLDPITDRLYGITAETGELWSIDKASGELTYQCTVPGVRKFKEIAGSSFHPLLNELWAYQWNTGLVTIDLDTCARTVRWKQPRISGEPRKWDAIAWRPDAVGIYGTRKSNLYYWSVTTQDFEVLCTNLPSKTEGLEYAPGDLLVGSSDSTIFSIDPVTCTTSNLYELEGREDIESLAFELACPCLASPIFLGFLTGEIEIDSCSDPVASFPFAVDPGTLLINLDSFLFALAGFDEEGTAGCLANNLIRLGNPDKIGACRDLLMAAATAQGVPCVPDE